MIFPGRVTLTDSFDTIFVWYDFMLHCTGDNDDGGAKSHLRQLLESRCGGAEIKLINKQRSQHTHAKMDTHKHTNVQTHAQLHLCINPTQPYAHTDTHTHTHTHTYTYTRATWLEPTARVKVCITNLEQRWSNHNEQCVCVCACVCVWGRGGGGCGCAETAMFT